MKKKIASLSMLLCLLAVFFVVPVHAENTYVRELRNYSNSISTASLTYSATAAQFDYVTESTLSGGMYSPVLITVRFTNNGTNDVKIANSYVDLTFSTYSELSGYDCYTSDLMVQMVKNGNDTPRYNIVASNGFSYGGHIVIPALSSLYLVFEVDIAAHYDISTAQVVSPYLDAVLVSVNASDVTTGEYLTSGSIPQQLDAISDMLGSNTSYVYGMNQNIVNMATQLGGIKNLLTEIKSLIQFTGNYSQTNGSNTDALYSTTFPNSGANVSVRVRYYKSYYITDDVEISGSNSLIESGTRVTPASLYVYIQKGANNSIQTYPSWTVTGLPTNAKEITSFYSNDFEVPYFASNSITLVHKIRMTSHGYVSTGRDHYTVVYFNLYSNASDSAPVATDLTLGLNYTREAVSDAYIPQNEYNILRDIFQYIQSPSQQNTGTVTDSNNAGTMSDQVHAQEEQWYRENDTAMENVGLSNYRYTQNQQNGIVGAVLQFEQMWLALGDWTLVYIFTLMLSLAVFILRHEPTTRMKQAREERSAFYAEAGRYYRESAKPSNEFVQRVRKFNGK